MPGKWRGRAKTQRRRLAGTSASLQTRRAGSLKRATHLRLPPLVRGRPSRGIDPGTSTTISHYAYVPHIAPWS